MSSAKIAQMFREACSCHLEGRVEEAEKRYLAVLRADQKHADALHNLSFIRVQQGKLEEAAKLLRRALIANPRLADAHNTLGSVLNSLERPAEAVVAYDRAIALKPDLAGAWFNRGHALRDLSRHAEALASYRRALALQPGAAEVHHNCGLALKALGQYTDAIAQYDAAIALKPDSHDSHHERGLALNIIARHEEAMAALRMAIALKPDIARQRGNLLLCLNYVADVTPEVLAAAHREWGELHPPAAPLHVSREIGRDDPDRRPRIGYVSPDFYQHSVAYFLRPLIEAHDRRAVEIFCYSDVVQPDDMTQRFQEAADHWVDIRSQTARAVAERIHADAIDILVDLTGHTKGNRLDVFALKPAPVQITWLGYPNTTGLAAMDYRITDAIADPPGTDRFHTEELVRLPRCFLCYAEERAGPASALPAREAGHVTFGSFNMLAKMTPHVVAVWARILHGVAGSRLFLKCSALTDPTTRERVLASFAEQGIARDRVMISGWIASPIDHLALYAQVDIGLDPFPYNGTTTTCQALWMGVPVITLAGNRHAARVGASLLTAAGLSELIATDADSYVSIAATLARDLDRLAVLRMGLREKLQASPLCDAGDFARTMEGVYRAAWKRWREPAAAVIPAPVMADPG